MGISICIGNYGSYGAGYLIDRWVDLPMRKADLAGILSGMRRQAERVAGTPCEEFYVSDYDGYPLGLEDRRIFNELTSIDDLNLLAQVMDEYPAQAELAEKVIACGMECASDVLELANLVMQADDVPYYDYDCSPWYLEHGRSAEEKLGATLAQGCEWWKALEEQNLQDYFDLERYGASEAQDYYLSDEGYVSARPWGIDLSAWSRDELEAQVAAVCDGRGEKDVR